MPEESSRTAATETRKLAAIKDPALLERHIAVLRKAGFK
jgi:hypothetical protein